MKTVIDHDIRTKLNLTPSQYIFIDCIHLFTLKKKYTLDWKDIKACICFTEEEIIETFKSIKDSGFIEIKSGGKIRTTDLWASNFLELDVVEETIRHLNVMAGTDYKSKSKTTVQCLNARQMEGFTLEDFKLVIDSKCEEWKGTDSEQYLRPITLFSLSKFEGYLQFAKSKNVKSNKFVV